MSRHFGVSNPAVLQVSQSLNLIRPSVVPTEPADPYFSNVSLLIKADGDNNSTTFVDSSNNNLAISRIGNTKISTTQSKYGGFFLQICKTIYIIINVPQRQEK
jgi:hypothetical protein